MVDVVLSQQSKRAVHSSKRSSRVVQVVTILVVVAVCYVASQTTDLDGIQKEIDKSSSSYNFSEALKSMDEMETAESSDSADIAETGKPSTPLLERIKRIQKACGALCKINDLDAFKRSQKPVENALFNMISVPDVDCNSILMNEDMDAGSMDFPEAPPEELMPFYSLNGLVHFRNFSGGILKAQYLGAVALQNVWNKEDIERDIELARKDQLKGTYGVFITNVASKQIAKLNVTDKSVLVIGSENPWVETLCLLHKAKQVTTLEYGSINSTHPQIRTMTPKDLREQYSAGTLGKFDRVVSFSSIEHSGLGRYGDALNPWGDILAIARAWCVTKTNGGMYLEIPSGKDAVEFNAHRVYGQYRWPLVTANWEQIEYTGSKDLNRVFDRVVGNPPGFIFRKVEYPSE